MRRGLFVFLMMVLVLRGLTGTAMAAGLVPPLAPAQAPHAQMLDHGHGDAASADHTPPAHAPLAAAARCTESSDPCAQPGHHASACSACEICHSAMLTPPAPPAQATPSAGHARPLASAPFDSAPAALAIKPPIA